MPLLPVTDAARLRTGLTYSTGRRTLPKVVALNTGKAGVLAKIGTYVELANALGEAYQRLPPKPRPLDILAFVLAGANACKQWTDTRRSMTYQSPTSFFSDESSEWERLPGFAWPVIRDNVCAPSIVSEYWSGEPGDYAMGEGTIDGIRFRWVQDGVSSEELVSGPFVLNGQTDQALAVLMRCFWARQPSQHITLIGRLVGEDLSFSDTFTTTEEIQQLTARARCFTDRQITRSILLTGRPGAGKSTAIRACVKQLGLRSLRLSASVLREAQSSHTGDGMVNLTGLVQMARPDVLIIDDVDHMMLDAYTLAFFEQARRHCRLLLTSCNDVKVLLGAALRPGRFDDIFEFETVDPSLLTRLSHGDPEAMERLGRLPIAYAQSFRDTADALGLEQAIDELDELELRAALIEGASKKDTDEEEDGEDDQG